MRSLAPCSFIVLALVLISAFTLEKSDDNAQGSFVTQKEDEPQRENPIENPPEETSMAPMDKVQEKQEQQKEIFDKQQEEKEKETTEQPAEKLPTDKNDRLTIQQLQEQLSAMHQELQQLRSKVDANADKDFTPVKYLNYKDRKRVLITGGSGFVGSHLVDFLMQEGHEVIALDNHFTGRRRNIEHWIGHPNFEMVHADVVNPFFIEVDQIYHLASPASPPHYMYNPVKTIKTNVLGVMNMLGLARRTKATILLASTSEVYGDPEVHPQPETYWGHVNPIGPRACYDEAKRVSETLMKAYQQQEKVDIRIARIFNTFGPRMHMADGRVVSNFILQSLKGEDITVYGDGAQTRSFQYVTDLVRGLVKLMNSNFTDPVNLGNPDEHTIVEFADLIKGLTNSTSKIVHKPKMEDDPRQRRPNITRAWEELQWKPETTMIDGLKKTIEYFHNELAHNQLQFGHGTFSTADQFKAPRTSIEHFDI